MNDDDDDEMLLKLLLTYLKPESRSWSTWDIMEGLEGGSVRKLNLGTIQFYAFLEVVQSEKFSRGSIVLLKN